MSYSIRFVVQALRKTTSKTANLKLVIYKTGKDRVIKVLPYSVITKDWDKNRQRLKSSSSLAVELNPLLNALQGKLEKQALLWENEGLSWTPKELYDTLDDKKSKESEKSSHAQTSVVYWIDYQIQRFKSKERFKDGEVIIGSPNANNYQWLKNFLEDFTKTKYKKDFSTYQFKDITELFLQAFVIYIKKRGHKKGDNAGLSHKLKNFKAVFNVAISKGCITSVNTSVFNSVKAEMKEAKATPKTTSRANIDLIKGSDRTQWSEEECFVIDLFLFSYYTGGMSNVDVCYLNHSCLKETHIQYTRHKCDRVANPALLPQAIKIIERYSVNTYGNYVFPIFNHKQQTERQKRHKVDRMTSKVNATLRKVCTSLGISDTISWYSSRGSYITNAIDADINPHVVADQAGNSVKVIEKHYYRVTDRRAMLDKISAAL